MKQLSIATALIITAFSTSLLAESESTSPAPIPGATSSDSQSAAPPSARKTPLTESGLNQRHEFLGNLVERSSSAKQLEKSGSPEAIAMHQKAKDTRAQAKEAIVSGDLEKADALLREASRLMMTAVRMARPEEVTGEKAKTDFDRRRDSVKTLLSTGERVAGEKSSSRPEFAKAEELVKEADALGAENKYSEGKVKLDMAYLLAKNALRDMREGEQLVADKNFASKEDEFKHEQLQNDDYLDLISGVIEGKTDPSWEAMAKKGRDLRTQADETAKSGDYEAALKTISESTKQLKNILRRSGFPII